mmetsp:Transcript_1446/g.2923  ORF Transcript_1446/g.2923 Transcript_1446/m.2923 type:complete len:172 (+) Transcript_1446:1430-1945(+)
MWHDILRDEGVAGSWFKSKSVALCGLPRTRSFVLVALAAACLVKLAWMSAASRSESEASWSSSASSRDSLLADITVALSIGPYPACAGRGRGSGSGAKAVVADGEPRAEEQDSAERKEGQEEGKTEEADVERNDAATSVVHVVSSQMVELVVDDGREDVGAGRAQGSAVDV